MPNTLENLKKQAKRWLKALRADDVRARERLLRAYPDAPSKPGLRDVQHALARERGVESWIALTQTPQDLVSSFLHYACWDHHAHGHATHDMQQSAAGNLLRLHPELATYDLYTAVVCGNVEEVRRILNERPQAARESGGTLKWTPLLYLCYGRVPVPPARDHALEIAEGLLDNGADPNAYYPAGESKYTALVGVAGEGEQDAYPHPRFKELYRLLLRRGADPYYMQVLYNTHFHGNVLWWLQLTLEQTGKIEWDKLDMGGYGSASRFLFRIVTDRGDKALAEWMLRNGADPNPRAATARALSKRSVYEDAIFHGYPEIAALLVQYGAKPVELVLTDVEAFLSACFRLDRETAKQLLKQHPEFRQSPHAMFAAAKHNRPDVLELLVDLGFSIEIEDNQKQRPLHKAAAHNALRAAKFLLERGAEPDPKETNWGATPIGFASYGQKREMVELLASYSSAIWTLTFNGMIGRVGELLDQSPDMVNAKTPNNLSLFWWLPNAEDAALDMADLLLARGGDPSSPAADGSTAADYAYKRGMRRLAERLERAPAAKVP